MAMEATGTAIWQGMIGNRKRWRPEETLETVIPTEAGPVTLTADWYDYEQSIVKLSWQPSDLTFAQIIQFAGEIPLPPYLKREATQADRETLPNHLFKAGGRRSRSHSRASFYTSRFRGLIQAGYRVRLSHTACRRGHLSAYQSG